MEHKPSYLNESDWTPWERIRNFWGHLFVTRAWMERMDDYHERCFWAQIGLLESQGHNINLSHLSEEQINKGRIIQKKSFKK